MLNANSRQFFNYKMKGRRARIRNRKRSKHYRSRFDRFLDNHEQIVEQQKLKRKNPYLPMMLKKPKVKTAEEARARDEMYNIVGTTILVMVVVAIFLV